MNSSDLESDTDDEHHRRRGAHKRTKVVNQDNNIDLILAGRARKISIEVPLDQKCRNQRLQRIIINSENDFKHLMGEVDGEKYEICGRPELELITVGFPTEPQLRKVKLNVVERDIEDEITDAGASHGPPSGVSDIRLLYCSSKTYFLFSPKHEDQLLALLKDYPKYELIIKSSVCSFGDHSFDTMDVKKQREWRRFVREFILPQLLDIERMSLMEDRLNFEIPYEDDGDFIDSDDSSSGGEEEEEQDEKLKKKRGKRKGKAAGKKKGAEAVGTPGAPRATISTKEAAPRQSTSARITQRMSSKKGIGLLAKRNTARATVNTSVPSTTTVHK